MQRDGTGPRPAQPVPLRRVLALSFSSEILGLAFLGNHVLDHEINVALPLASIRLRFASRQLQELQQI
jgi:hypothetical protein